MIPGVAPIDIATLAAQQRGVLSKADLQAVLAERHRAAFARRANALVRSGAVRRFCRGWYVTPAFDLATLSQRLGPRSYVSFHTVLAEHLIVGTASARHLIACTTGQAQTYRGLDHEIVHLHIAEHLDFGHAPRDGVKFADAEKAVLDVLYFHVRGRRFPFDIHSDLDLTRLDQRRLRSYVRRYRNPKFVTFAERVLGLA